MPPQWEVVKRHRATLIRSLLGVSGKRGSKEMTPSNKTLFLGVTTEI